MALLLLYLLFNAVFVNFYAFLLWLLMLKVSVLVFKRIRKIIPYLKLTFKLRKWIVGKTFHWQYLIFSQRLSKFNFMYGFVQDGSDFLLSGCNFAFKRSIANIFENFVIAFAAKIIHYLMQCEYEEHKFSLIYKNYLQYF